MKEKYRDDFDNFVEKYHLVSKPDNSRTLYYFSCFGYEGLLTLKELRAATAEFKKLGNGCWKCVAREATVSDLERLQFKND